MTNNAQYEFLTSYVREGDHGTLKDALKDALQLLDPSDMESTISGLWAENNATISGITTEVFQIMYGTDVSPNKHGRYVRVDSEGIVSRLTAEEELAGNQKAAELTKGNQKIYDILQMYDARNDRREVRRPAA